MFDGKGEWSFGNECSRNLAIFGVANSSSSRADNRKSIFLVLSEGDVFGLNGSFGAPKKKSLVLFIVKQIQNFA